MATILHVADPRIDHETSAESADGEESDGDTESADDLGGFGTLVERARGLGVEAVLFTGNLFSRGRPDEKAVARVVGHLDDLDAAGIRFLALLGRNDKRHLDALDPVFDHSAVERLGTKPADVGETTAIYGVDYRDSDDLRAFLDDEDQLTPAAGASNTMLAIPRKLSPPLDEAEAVTQPYEIAANVNAYLDAIAGGGIQEAATWSHDDNDFGVYYPGSMNPRWADAIDGPQAILYEEDGYDLVRRQVSLDAPSAAAEGVLLGDEDTPSDAEAGSSSEGGATGDSETTPLDAEIASLESLLSEYDQSSLADADVETLADLYGLLSEAKSMLDDRRKEVRDVLLEKTAPGSQYRGTRASVYHYHSTSRRLRDEESVLAALEGAGVSRDEVTTETVDSEKVAEVVESGDVPEDAVFDEQTRTYIQKREVDLDGV